MNTANLPKPEPNLTAPCSPCSLNKYISKTAEIEEAKQLAADLLTLEFATPFQLRPGERIIACRKFRNALRADLLDGQNTACFRPALERARLLMAKLKEQNHALS